MIKIVIGVVLCGLVLTGGYFFLRGEGPGDTKDMLTAQQYTLPLSTSSVPATALPASSTVPSAVITTSNHIKKIMQATLHTSQGDITLEFYPEQAPKTVANFIKLAQSGFYDNTKFHRVIKGFMNQGGDPLSKDDSQAARWGQGGPGYAIADEITPTNDNAAGTIAMANSGPNSAGSQFYINAVTNSSLNKGYTVFGRVTAGMDVVLAINNTATDRANDRPLQPIVLKSVTLK